MFRFIITNKSTRLAFFLWLFSTGLGIGATWENNHYATIAHLEREAPKKGIAWLKNQLDTAYQTKEDVPIGILYRTLATMYRYVVQYDSANDYLNKAREWHLFRNESIPAELYLEEGLIHMNKGLLAEGMDSYLKALKSYDEIGSAIGRGQCLYNIGFLYNIQFNYDTALVYFQQSLNIFSSLSDSVGRAQALNGIGLVWMRREEYGQARDTFLTALSYISEETQPRLVAKLYNNIGITYEDQGLFEQSRMYYQRSLKIKERLDDLRGMASTYGNLADNYRQSGNFEQAIQFTKLGEELAIKTQALDYLVSSYKRYHLCYEDMGDYRSALNYHRLYKRAQDSLTNENTQKQMQELRTRYEVEKSSSENLRLNELASQREIDLNQQRYYTIGGVAGFLIVSIFALAIFQVYRRYRTLSESLSTKNKEIQEINDTLQQVLEENKLMTGLMVHDLRAPITRILAHSDVLSGKELTQEQRQELLGKIKSELAYGRKMINEILYLESNEVPKPERLEANKIMEQVIEEFRVEAERKELFIHFLNSSESIYFLADRSNMHRILENILSNAIKFTPYGKRVVCKVHKSVKEVYFSIKDEGPGFTEKDLALAFKKFTRLSARPTGGESSTGLGLAIVHRLTAEMHGKVEIFSHNSGAELEIRLPLEEKGVYWSELQEDGM